MKKFSKEEVENAKRESVDSYYTRSWYNVYDKLQPIFIDIIQDTFFIKIFVTSGVYSREIGSSSVLSFLQKHQNIVNMQELPYLQLATIFTLWKSNELAQTYQVCQNLLSKHPKMAEVWYIMSKVYIEYQKYDKSLECIMNCIKLNPRISNYYQRCSEILFFQKKYKESLQFVVFAMKMASSEKLIKLRIKTLIVNKIDEPIEQVLERIDDLVLKYPNDRKSHLWLKSLYIQHNFETTLFQNAFEWIQDSIISSGRRISLFKYRILNWFAIRLKNWSIVVETSELILKNAPTSDSYTKLLLVISKYHLGENQVQECLELNQETSSNSILFDSLFISGKILYNDNQPENVVKLMTKCLELMEHLEDKISIFLSIQTKISLEIECNYLIGKSLNSKDKIKYLKVCISLDPENINYWNDYIHSIEEFYSRKDLIYFTSIYQYCRLVSRSKMDSKTKLKYWNECYESSLIFLDENIQLESLTSLLQLENNPIKEKLLIQLLMKHSKKDKISSYFWEKYNISKNPLDLISYSLSFLN